MSRYERSSFSQVPLWNNLATMSEDVVSQTWSSFQKTLTLIAEFPELAPFPPMRQLASFILEIPPPSSGASLKKLLESAFVPFISLEKKDTHLTGYYEPIIEGSLEVDPLYPIPLYSLPSDLLYIPDLGPLNPSLCHVRWAGRKNHEGQVIPYFTRWEIQNGALKNEIPLLWLKNELDAYFLHIQGSGKIKLSTGELISITYTATNGHPYCSIGKALIDQGIFEGTSPLTYEILCGYLKNLDPQNLSRVLAINPSYIFFELSTNKKECEGPGPWGTFGLPFKKVTLTPYHSVAVDPTSIPLGIPLWLSCETLPHPLLCMTNDTGSAIKGGYRMDLFCGEGKKGLEEAGTLNHPAQTSLLLPKETESILRL